MVSLQYRITYHFLDLILAKHVCNEPFVLEHLKAFLLVHDGLRLVCVEDVFGGLELGLNFFLQMRFECFF